MKHLHLWDSREQKAVLSPTQVSTAGGAAPVLPLNRISVWRGTDPSLAVLLLPIIPRSAEFFLFLFFLTKSWSVLISELIKALQRNRTFRMTYHCRSCKPTKHLQTVGSSYPKLRISTGSRGTPAIPMVRKSISVVLSPLCETSTRTAFPGHQVGTFSASL
jgi:hypothetical protein